MAMYPAPPELLDRYVCMQYIMFIIGPWEIRIKF